MNLNSVSNESSDRKSHLKKVISEFEKWWNNDSHKANKDFYEDAITYRSLSSLSKQDFVDFFYKFVSEGGLVQSRGYRTKNKFRSTIVADFDNFRDFILKPFQSKFQLEKWFLDLNKFNGFGIGIATIFLNRIDRYKYPIMNNKTLQALNKLGYKILSTKSWKNYQLVKQYQDDLISKYPSLENYHKTDALNHFLVAVCQGQELMSDLHKIENFANELEQSEIEQKTRGINKDIDKEELHKEILDCENQTSEEVTIKGKRYKRSNYLMAKIKRYRDYKCQFCSTKIKKGNGGYYIEACHIKPKARGGADALNNILILCPNCHKLFDYGKKEKEKTKNNKYYVVLNGEEYTATLT